MDGSQLPMTFRSWVVDWKHHYFLDYLTYTSEYMKNYTCLLYTSDAADEL